MAEQDNYNPEKPNPDFDISATHAEDATPYESAETGFYTLKHADIDSSNPRDLEAIQDRIIRIIAYFEEAKRPDRVIAIMRYAEWLDPEKDRPTYVSAIMYHIKQSDKKKEDPIYRNNTNDERTPDQHIEEAKSLAKEVGLEALVERVK